MRECHPNPVSIGSLLAIGMLASLPLVSGIATATRSTWCRDLFPTAPVALYCYHPRHEVLTVLWLRAYTWGLSRKAWGRHKTASAVAGGAA